MGLFSKKKKNIEADDLYLTENEDTEIDGVKGIGKGEQVEMPFVLTPEEIKGTKERKPVKNDNGLSPLEALRQKLLASTANTQEEPEESEPEEVKQPVQKLNETEINEEEPKVQSFFTVNTDIDDKEEDKAEKANSEAEIENEDTVSLSADFKIKDNSESTPAILDAASLFGESDADFKSKEIKETEETEEQKAKDNILPEEADISLPYEGEAGKDVSDVSNEDVLKESEEASETVFEKSFSDFKAESEVNEETPVFNDDVSKDIFDMFAGKKADDIPESKVYIPTSAVKKPEEAGDESLLENCKPFILDGSEDESTLEKKPEYTLDSVQKILGLEDEEPEEQSEPTRVFDAVKEDIPDISDIDSKAKIPFIEALPTEEISATSPIVIDDALLGNTAELDGDYLPKYAVSPVLTEKLNEEEEYIPKEEYKDFSDVKKIRRIILSLRRSFFLKSFVSAVCLIALFLLKIPLFNDLLTSSPSALSIVNAVLLIIPGIFSLDMFKSISDLIRRRSNVQILLALAYLSSLICVFTPVMFKFTDLTKISGITTATVFALLLRNSLLFKKYCYIYKNFRIIANKSEKNALYLIDDAPTTVTMARRAIDGDVLVASSRKAKNISDFMKHSFEDVDYNSNVRLLLVVAILFSAISVIFAATISGDKSIENITSIFAALNLFFALPLSIAANIMPLSIASRHLNKYGAMIAGIKSAQKIEQANAMAFECNKLFPSGSVTLSDMKVLSPNKLDETIAAACAITLKMKSPLYPIFKQILDTGNITALPEQDSIKYDENLGLTGWVNDERIYIGNRSLMEVRGIKIPSVDIDKKILKNGYFPIYLSRGNSACALLSVKYTPDNLTAKEVRKVSDLGVTLLINNCDQNITESMVKDYFDLYNDDSTVKVMNGSGVHMYKTATAETETLSAPAVCGETLKGLSAVVYAANKIKKSKRVLDVLFTVFAVIGAMVFAYTSVYGNPISYSYILVYQLVTYIIGFLSCIFNKP